MFGLDDTYRTRLNWYRFVSLLYHAWHFLPFRQSFKTLIWPLHGIDYIIFSRCHLEILRSMTFTYFPWVLFYLEPFYRFWRFSTSFIWIYNIRQIFYFMISWLEFNFENSLDSQIFNSIQSIFQKVSFPLNFCKFLDFSASI